MKYVLDASIILANLNGEPGGERLQDYLDDGIISVVTYVEVVTKLMDGGATFQIAAESLAVLGLPISELTLPLAMRAAELRNATRKHGLSLADRVCLATAESRGAVAVTADRAWAAAAVGIDVELIR